MLCTMKETNRITGSFTGTIDALLTHCASLDVDIFDQDYPEDHELPQEIQQFMQENDMSQEQLVEFAKQQMIQQELDNLIEEGKVEIIGYTSDGNPIYQSVQK